MSINQRGNHRSCNDIKRDRIEEQKRLRKQDSVKKVFKNIGKSITIVFGLIILIAGLIVAKIGLQYGSEFSTMFNRAKSKVELATRETFNSKQPTRVFDKNGEKIYEFKNVDYVYTEFDNLNPYVMKAFMAIEDNRFLKHNGIDYIGTIRAILVTLTGGAVQGGSSLNQQLAKNVFLTHDRTITRKIEEAVIASNLDRKFTKEEILEFYVNNIYYGHGNYSFESASQYYFGKTNKELTIGEVAVLAGVINNPTKYDPIRKNETSKKRRDRILNKMFEEGYISEEVCEKEKAKPLTVNPQERNLDNSIKDDTVSYAIDTATELFMQQNGFQFQYEFKTKEDRQAYWKYYNEEYKEMRNQILTGGYEIHTTIDKELDKKLLDISNKYLKGYTAKTEDGIYKKQVSLTAIDNKTGEVISMVGGRGQDNDFLNRAYQSPRQPGSTIKPLVAYAPAFERGYVPSSVMVDAPVNKGPKNAGGGYSGSVTLRHALEKSINTIPYRLATNLGGDVIVSYLANMQFQTLTETDYNPIIAVGGFTKGTTTEEMASGFSTLARNGEFIKPTNIKKIVKINTGDVVYENTYDSVRVYDEGASYLTTDSLKGVLTNGTGTRFKPSYPHVAGKTGTTNAKKDSWMIGYTPYYTVAVWVGDDKPTPQGTTTIAGSIWRDSIDLLNKDKKVVDFEKPKSVKTYKGALVNDIYLNKKGNNSQKRKKIEDERIRKENEIHAQRIADEDYRIIYGLTKEEELAREERAEIALSELKAYTLTSESQFGELDSLLEEARLAIEEVKHKLAYNRFLNTYNSLRTKFNSIKYNILNPPQEEEVIEPEPTPPPEPENNNSNSNNSGSNNNSSSNNSNSNSSSSNSSSSNSSSSNNSSSEGQTPTPTPTPPSGSVESTPSTGETEEA